MHSAQFLSVMERMTPEGQLRALCEYFAPRPRTARKLPTEQLVTGLVFHQLQPSGTLADHNTKLHGIRMSDSACAQRRQNLPVELFEQIMDSALAPLADSRHHPESFFEGYRLLGIDGTQWSVTNTPAIVSALVLASAVIARLRVDSATHLKVPPTRLSFFKLMLETQGLWQAFAMFGDMLTHAQRAHAFAQYLESVRHTALLKERRNRSCPRVLRQPVSGWPRKTDQPSHTGNIDINVVRI